MFLKHSPKENPNDADSFDEWQPPLSKLKTSKVSVALSGILKGLIATNVQSHYVEATPSPLIGGGYTPSHVPWFTGVKRELKQRRQPEVKSFPFL